MDRQLGIRRLPPRRLEVIKFPKAVVVLVADGVHSDYAFWQYAYYGILQGHPDTFNGDYAALRKYCLPMRLSLCIRAKIERRSSLGSLRVRKVIVQDHADQKVRVDL